MYDYDYKTMLDSLKQYNDENKYIDELVKLIRVIQYERQAFVKNSDNNLARDEFFDFLKNEFIEVYRIYKEKKQTKTNVSEDIEFVGFGRSSLAFRIGDYVLKISKRKTNNILYEFQCLIPVFYFVENKISDNEYYSLQLTPYVDTKDLTKEDTYLAYKELRKLGYIWNDPKPSNIGRIINDFEYLDKVYKSGDIVIIDLEDLAYVGEYTPEAVMDELAFDSYNPRTYTFEERYNEERMKKGKIK